MSKTPLKVWLPLVICLLTVSLSAQEPIVVQPGAPGQPTKVLPSSTRPTLPPASKKDTEFMQGMIHHHAQAVEMAALIEERTENTEIRLLGSRISHSQESEMRFMRRWLELRGEPIGVHAQVDHSDHGHPPNMSEIPRALMPGMLTPKQMAALKKARGAEFDRQFLTGMIQHHQGALTMVKDLLDTPGAGQDAELFNFTTDVDSGQRAEIEIMRNLLNKIPVRTKS